MCIMFPFPCPHPCCTLTSSFSSFLPRVLSSTSLLPYSYLDFFLSWTTFPSYVLFPHVILLGLLFHVILNTKRFVGFLCPSVMSFLSGVSFILTRPGKLPRGRFRQEFNLPGLAPNPPSGGAAQCLSVFRPDGDFHKLKNAPRHVSLRHPHSGMQKSLGLGGAVFAHNVGRVFRGSQEASTPQFGLGEISQFDRSFHLLGERFLPHKARGPPAVSPSGFGFGSQHLPPSGGGGSYSGDSHTPDFWSEPTPEGFFP